MTFKPGLLLAALTALLPPIATAKAADSYMAFRGTYGIPSDVTTNIGGLPLKATLDDGWGGSVAFGERSDWLGLRFEVEGLYREFAADKLESVGLELPLDGHVDLYGPMVNAIYDLPIGGPITPFIGGGVGAAGVNVAAPQYELNLIEHSAWGFALEGRAGIRAQIGEHTGVTAAVRYFDVPRITLHAVGDVPFETSFSVESVELGIDFSL